MKPTSSQIKAHSLRYLKVVEWSEADGLYIGSAPPIIGQCCHGHTEAEVLAQLGVIVDEWVEVFLRDGNPLPAASAGKVFSGKFLVRVTPEIHQKAALKARARGEILGHRGHGEGKCERRRERARVAAISK
jgi:predicted RNase H-like HicB family nuclease